MKLRSLHRRHVRDLLASQRGRLSKNSVRLIRATLSRMLGDAVEDGILMTNPAQGLPRRGRKSAESITQAERQQRIRPMSLEHLAVFLAAAADVCTHGLYTLFLTLADTGVRPGEVFALQWEDMDLAGRSFCIERAISAGAVKSTKTGERRYVDLTQRLAEALNRWQAEAEAEALMDGRDLPPWVFASRAGTPLDLSAVTKRFKAVLHMAGLPRHRLYDLRHSFASHLLGEGAPITYVAAQLGHAKPTTTLAHYAHWLPRGDKTWADRLAARRAAIEVGTRSWHQTGSAAGDVAELPETTGAGGGS